jgi:CheY-like chemotaxis protein/DNA-directed RNA polymerase specialized sigma24 family protein
MALPIGLSSHVPYLRRYARALTGDQATGDTYVRATLEALVAGERLLAPDMPTRVALYRTFRTLWSSTGARLEGPQDDVIGSPVEAASRRLLRIPPRSRQAFLLTAMEGFSNRDAADILDTDVAELAALNAAAQAEIEADLATDVLIIEDEPVIAADIEAMLGELGHRVIGIATTRGESAQLVREHAPGLVLADIQLADGSSGIDAVKDILGVTSVPVVFITAFPERLLTGERPEPTFLITKPFQPATVKAVIGQALFFHPQQPLATAAA